MFVTIAAEAASKLFHAFEEEGRSREFVRRFFRELGSEEHNEPRPGGIQGAHP